MVIKKKAADVTCSDPKIDDPDRKGKVESGVGHAQETPSKGLRFETLEEAQAYLDQKSDRAKLPLPDLRRVWASLAAVSCRVVFF